MTFSVGIGLTNECDLRCPHCYRSDATVDRLSLAAVETTPENDPRLPAAGHRVAGRLVEKLGREVGSVSQLNWRRIMRPERPNPAEDVLR